MSHSSGTDEKLFTQFISEVKEIEKKDSVYTSKQQIDRLLRPGSSYANLNPFDVLMLDNLDAPLDQVKKQYKKLSILLHPDKNPNDADRAKSAFAVVTKAYKSLEDEQTRSQIMEVVEEARHRTRQTANEKRKRLKKDAKSDLEPIDEDDPVKFDKAVRVLIMKLFAENERKRRSAMEKAADQKKRKHEEEQAEMDQKREKEEWERNYEQSRESRINSWKNFQTNKKTKKQKEFRPPQHKAESR